MHIPRLTAYLPLGFFLVTTVGYQTGKFGKDDVTAYGGHILLGKGFESAPLRPVVSFEYSYASKDRDPYDGKRQTFYGVFGAKDLMYGRMNLFDWQNLKDLQLNLTLLPLGVFQSKVEAHRFWLAQAKDGWSLNPGRYRDKYGQSGDDVGVEFDLVGIWKAKRLLPRDFGDIEFQAGCGHFWPGDFIRNTADSKDANWLYFQVVYSLGL